MKKFTIYGLAIAMSFPLVTGCATPNKAFQQSLKPPVQQEEKISRNSQHPYAAINGT